MKCTCSTLSTACHLPCHPKGGFPARAAPYAHPQSKHAALVLTTHLSTFCCCLLAGRARDVLAMSFDSDLEVGFHLHAWARSIATAAQSDVEQWVRSFQLKKRTIHESPYGSVWLDDKMDGRLD